MRQIRSYFLGVISVCVFAYSSATVAVHKVAVCAISRVAIQGKNPGVRETQVEAFRKLPQEEKTRAIECILTKEAWPAPAGEQVAFAASFLLENGTSSNDERNELVAQLLDNPSFPVRNEAAWLSIQMKPNDRLLKKLAELVTTDYLSPKWKVGWLPKSVVEHAESIKPYLPIDAMIRQLQTVDPCGSAELLEMLESTKDSKAVAAVKAFWKKHKNPECG